MARQLAVPGTEDVVDQEIEDAAEKVGDLCERRMGLQKHEKDARSALAKLMKERKRRIYKMKDGRVAELTVATEEKVRVRKPKAARSFGRRGKKHAAEE